jgi:hypothetical protein
LAAVRPKGPAHIYTVADTTYEETEAAFGAMTGSIFIAKNKSSTVQARSQDDQTQQGQLNDRLLLNSDCGPTVTPQEVVDLSLDRMMPMTEK